ncbi:hypothetical protein HNO89_000453 [Sporosarcina luteola]|nr:hypothetical protein [Sporosarcina luteola]
MANQPTKYRKFVMGAASAALVASAVAPVASAKVFTDTADNTHGKAIDALSDAGIITGYPDGRFQPNKTLTRSDVVKLMGKWLVSEGYKVPTDYKTNIRFSDLKSTTNDELLQYAAVVKDNGVFVGTPDGKLDPAGDITRQNMAIVLVRAFDRVNDIDLATYVAGKDFKRDVTDLGTAKAEARPAIDVLDFFDITNPEVPTFNPRNTTTRGHFATFLYKFINADFSDVAPGAVVGDAAVKSVNATTVEVTFKEPVENVNSLNFTIEGLTVSNAAVKQSDNKTVVLTTAVQEGGKEYTVSLDGKEIGKFKGVSAVVPTKIDITTQSVQGKTGAQAIISADVGVKQAGIPVTFNVKADTNNTLNKDQVFEAVTNADGIATFSYTQYAAGTDQVTAYPTGAPTVRSHAYVFWGVDTILTLEPTDKKGNSVNNGEDKTYKLTYKDPKTGKPVANKKFNITFEENVNVNIDKTSKATVNGVNPRQLLNNENPIVATVTTDSKGEAVFTVSGHNTSVTPIVFEDLGTNSTIQNTTYEADKLQAKAEKVTFAAIQATYDIDVVRDGGEEAAVGVTNGREYKITVKTKDGKVAANELVNIAFNEDIDRNIHTNTQAYFIKEDANDNPYKAGDSIVVKTDSKGEATFVIGSDYDKDYATPIAWIDINSSNAKEGKLDEGESYKLAAISYFAQAKLTDGTVKAYNDAENPNKSVKELNGLQTATFKFTAANQSGKTMSLPSGYEIDATFTVFNTGSNDITVNGQVVSPNRSYTTARIKGAVPSIDVASVDNKTTSVRVVANGTAVPFNNYTDLRPINLGSHTAELKFTSTLAVGESYTGVVTAIDTTNKKITFSGKSAISYSGATYKNQNAVTITQAEFERQITANTGNARVTYTKNGDNVTFEIVSLANDASTDYSALQSALSNANDLVKKAVAGTEPGQYPQAAIDTYKAAVASATTVLNNNSATQAAVDKAVTDLAAATKAFNDAQVKANVGLEITSATAVGTDLSALLGNYTYTVEGTVADSTVKEVTLTFTGADAAKSETVTVTDGKFSFTAKPGDLYGVYSKVEASVGDQKVEKAISTSVQ